MKEYINLLTAIIIAVGIVLAALIMRTPTYRVYTSPRAVILVNTRNDSTWHLYHDTKHGLVWRKLGYVIPNAFLGDDEKKGDEKKEKD